MRWLRSGIWIVCAALLVCATACKKAAKSDTATVNLKGAAEVISALDKKDYDAAIRGMVEIKTALTDEQRQEYSKLLRKVKDVMLERIATDEAAAKAYQGLRFLESGR